MRFPGGFCRNTEKDVLDSIDELFYSKNKAAVLNEFVTKPPSGVVDPILKKRITIPYEGSSSGLGRPYVRRLGLGTAGSIRRRSGRPGSFVSPWGRGGLALEYAK